MIPICVVQCIRNNEGVDLSSRLFSCLCCIDSTQKLFLKFILFINIHSVCLRIPFTLGGTAYSKYLAVDLARFALKGLIDKTALDPSTVDYIYYGSVIQEPRTSNIAREAAMVCYFRVHTKT